MGSSESFRTSKTQGPRQDTLELLNRPTKVDVPVRFSKQLVASRSLAELEIVGEFCPFLFAYEMVNRRVKPVYLRAGVCGRVEWGVQGPRVLRTGELNGFTCGLK